jgi:hypothetical protein
MKYEKEDCGVNAKVTGRRRSSAAEVTRGVMSHNPNRADKVPAAFVATGNSRVAQASREINDQFGHAENHRKNDFNTVGRGAKAGEQVRGHSSSRPTGFTENGVDALGCRDFRELPRAKRGIDYARSND